LSAFDLKVSVLKAMSDDLAGDEGTLGAAAPPDGKRRPDNFMVRRSFRGAMINRFAAAWDDPIRRAKILRSLWWISTGFTLFGFAVIFYRVLFAR